MNCALSGCNSSDCRGDGRVARPFGFGREEAEQEAASTEIDNGRFARHHQSRAIGRKASEGAVVEAHDEPYDARADLRSLRRFDGERQSIPDLSGRAFLEASRQRQTDNADEKAPSQRDTVPRISSPRRS